jgi:rhodanese-related sulfurtransferase
MNIVRSSTIIIISFFFFSNISLAEKPFAPEKIPGTILVSAEETVKLILNTPNLIIIDSRKDNEYTKGHIQGAINLLDTKMTLDKLKKHVPNKSTPLLFYCNGERCLRSSRAAIVARDGGYKLIYWFRGGWSEWVKKSMPVSR